MRPDPEGAGSGFPPVCTASSANGGKPCIWWSAPDCAKLRFGSGDRVFRTVADIERENAVVETKAPTSGILARFLAADGAALAMGASMGIVRNAP